MKKNKLFYIILFLMITFTAFGCNKNEECDECKECPTAPECLECPDCPTAPECLECPDCPTAPECPECEEKNTKVYLGIDLIDENLDLFEGKRVGLITNQSGVNSEFKSSIDVLFEKVNLVALYAPEHGIRGSADAGASVGSEIDPVTKLPIYSLYGNTLKPTKEMLDKVDVLCIDIQDVGARFYTYIYTMAYAMKACSEYGKEFIVFDRPNPVSGDVVDGTLLDEKYSSFVGLYSIATRHGMTIGELAGLFNTEENINCDLKVIKMKDYKREYYMDDCDVPWIMPSPNMPTLDTAIVYTGTCVFEGTNISEGRGTTRPFELIGAPFIDSLELANKLNELNLDGVFFRSASFTPTTSKFQGNTCYGVQVHVIDRESFDSVKTGLAMLEVIRTLYPNDFKILNEKSSSCMLNLLTGCSYIKEHKYSLEEQFELIDKDIAAFKEIRAKYLLY